MELRVSTEGIERVVCGVSDVTTCRDVIIAVARTVGKTGRYSLVETYHGRQRPLSASERLKARLSETAGSARLSLVHSAEPDHATNVTRHETRHVRRGQVNCFIESRKSAPLNKSRSVGCCRSLVADNHRVPVPQKDQQSDQANVTGGTSLPETLKNARISSDQKTHTPDFQRVGAISQSTEEWNAQKQEVPAELDGPRLSVSSVSSCSSGEFIPHLPAHLPLGCEQSSDDIHSSTLLRSQLRCVSREQVLQLLSQQQDEISRRETELLNLNSEISVIEGSLESLKHNGQSLSVKLSELEEMERRVNEELEELELVSWNDKLQIETVRCAQLEADAEALMSKTAWTETEIDRWQRQVVEITTLTETTKTNSQQMDDNKTRLKEQLESLELQLAESRRHNHDCRSALQQVEKTIESDAKLVQARLEEHLRLEQQLEMSRKASSQFQRSLSFDGEVRTKKNMKGRSSRVTVGDFRRVNVAFSCQI